MNEGVFDVWGNRQFSDKKEPSSRGGWPYYPPNSDWKRFGLNIKEWYKDNKWMGRDGKEEEWAIGYCCVNNERRNIGDIIFTASKKNPFIHTVVNSIDVGPNKGKFQEKHCGRGVILAPKVDSFILNEKNRKKPMISHPTCIEVAGRLYWFILLIQCRVKSDSIRVPKDWEGEYFVVNDSDDIRPYGILLKQISQIEADLYQVSSPTKV